MVNLKIENILRRLKKLNTSHGPIALCDTMSTGMLVRHLRKYHQGLYDEMMG
jgi:hypothetical protein